MTESTNAPPLRASLLSREPAEINLAPTPELPDVWAAVLEMPVANGQTATVVAVADGSASLYTTTGFGIIGAGFRPAVREAATVFLDAMQAAHTDLALASPTDVPFPSPGSLSLVALTHGGIRRIELPQGEADRPTVIGAALRAGNELLTQIRLDYESREAPR